MYDELVKRLREEASSWCINCCYRTGECICAASDDHKRDCDIYSKLEAADAIDELRKAILRLEDESGIYDELPTVYIYPTKWIPVTERLPEEDGKYLTVHTLNSIPPQPWIEVCWFAKDLYKVDKYDFHDKKKKSGFYQYDSEWGNFEITGISHWMPLPEAPKDGE